MIICRRYIMPSMPPHHYDYAGNPECVCARAQRQGENYPIRLRQYKSEEENSEEEPR
jgi:hypothetical protein